MHCSIKRENCAIRTKHFLWGGGTVGGHSKKFNVFGGQEENVSSKENSSAPPPRDFMNERSLMGQVAEHNVESNLPQGMLLPVLCRCNVYKVRNKEAVSSLILLFSLT